ncbi:hypothetical protein MJO28_001562 [Puccinia striiformis f. sp. tritici]|uniref:Acyl-CoA thioesterase II n=2 Tax=Puccinia striiformis TaxID=27350 RepID=A0A2S4V6R6_9BASI|nr:hypothetical protein MJO28_001562 [Puccinia striiformis f. sp. tritici]POW05155.1 hypothetical protein PSTT_09905 [Puccinia striiformis]
MITSKQGQHIEEVVGLQEVDENVFKSVKLWKLDHGDNVFGGIVIAQATHAAIKTVQVGLHLHSLHCYFSGFADASVPTGIVYQVEMIRDGNSYATRSVKAIQNSRCIFSLLCSFHRPEINQLIFKTKIDLSGVIAPESCQSLEVSLQNHIDENRDSLPPKTLNFVELQIKQIKANAFEHRDTSPAPYYSKKHGSSQAYWFRARGRIQPDPSYHKIILAYASEYVCFLRSSQYGRALNIQSHSSFGFIDTVRIGMGLHSPGGPLPRASMLVSLSHSMFFYDHDFDVSEWMLYKMEAETAKDGRGLVVGRIYARDGRLLAVCAQEGVVRAEGHVKEVGPKL